MTNEFSRKVRIRSGDSVAGHSIVVMDAESGEMLTNIVRMTVWMDARETTRVEVVYYEQTEDDHLCLSSHSLPLLHVKQIQTEVDIDVVAYELREA